MRARARQQSNSLPVGFLKKKRVQSHEKERMLAQVRGRLSSRSGSMLYILKATKRVGFAVLENSPLPPVSSIWLLFSKVIAAD